MPWEVCPCRGEAVRGHSCWVGGWCRRAFCEVERDLSRFTGQGNMEREREKGPLMKVLEAESSRRGWPRPGRAQGRGT